MALLGVADGAQPQSNTLLLQKAGKAHGLRKHLSGFQREASNTKNPYMLSQLPLLY